ncbi:MAG TPA: alpha/beta fold hydrolase [Candidatus Dependentiae bacterium]|nr:alpha/beta fold hydrolase [Candidatus Dependentiae bacterium]HRQ62447.1 alpha/beta fold hydrolase [Candidatus Dependentiae bacterium]
MNIHIISQLSRQGLKIALMAFCVVFLSSLEAQDKANLDAQAIVEQAYPQIYGKVISREENTITNAIVERVKIYPREHAGVKTKIERSGILVRYKNAKATVLVCHGFMCDKHDAGLLRRLFPRGKYNVMTFDFRAHGENVAGQECTLGHDEAHDVIAAGKFLRNHPDLHNKPLFVYGFSMGAAASIEAQSRKKLFDAMVLDCPFDSSEKILQRSLDSITFSVFGYKFELPCKNYIRQYAFHPYVQSFVKALLKTVAQMDTQNIQMNIPRFSPQESVKNISVPCFFIHCRNDEKVPIEAGKSVFTGAAGPKKMWITNGRRHFDSYFYNPEGYTEKVRSFLNDVLHGKYRSNNEPQIIEDAHETVSIGDKHEASL